MFRILSNMYMNMYKKNGSFLKKKYNESDDFKNDNLAKCHTSYNVSITN